MSAIILTTVALIGGLALLALTFKLKSYTTLKVRPQHYEKGKEQTEG